MRSALKLALEADDPNKCVEGDALVELENVRCTGFLMLFFVENPDGRTATLDICGGVIPARAELMLSQYYPLIFAKMSRAAYSSEGV